VQCRIAAIFVKKLVFSVKGSVSGSLGPCSEMAPNDPEARFELTISLLFFVASGISLTESLFFLLSALTFQRKEANLYTDENAISRLNLGIHAAAPAVLHGVCENIKFERNKRSVVRLSAKNSNQDPQLKRSGIHTKESFTGSARWPMPGQGRWKP
jgi:hypothetical protein